MNKYAKHSMDRSKAQGFRLLATPNMEKENTIMMRNYCTRVWVLSSNGIKVFPYTGIRGEKKGSYSVNFTSDNNKFEGCSEEQLMTAIAGGKFEDRGRIRMLPMDANAGKGNNAFVPRFFDGMPIPRSR